MKSDLFQSCGHCWVFQIWWHIECTLTASSLKFWSSSVASPSPPLTLFIVMLPKAYLTLHSRKSGCRWMITPSWLSGSLKPFLCSSSVDSCHLLLISSASVRSLPFLSFYRVHVCMKCSLGISNFLEEISSLSHFCCFPLLLCIVHLGRLSDLSLLFLPWEPHEEYKEAKRYHTGRWTPQVSRVPIC